MSVCCLSIFYRNLPRAGSLFANHDHECVFLVNVVPLFLPLPPFVICNGSCICCPVAAYEKHRLLRKLIFVRWKFKNVDLILMVYWSHLNRFVFPLDLLNYWSNLGASKSNIKVIRFLNLCLLLSELSITTVADVCIPMYMNYTFAVSISFDLMLIIIAFWIPEELM